MVRLPYDKYERTGTHSVSGFKNRRILVKFH
jgi:hypothetical protein